MRVARFVIFLSAVAACAQRQPRPLSQEAVQPDSKLIRPTMILWKTGLVETITPAMLGSRKTWRVTHYSQDPTDTETNEYDLYDLDRGTLAPLRSVMNTKEFRLEVNFGAKESILRKNTNQGATTEKVPLSRPVQAEGPGSAVLVAALPLTVGYKVRYAIVDRWHGEGGSRLKMVTLSVSKRVAENTAMGNQEIYELLIKPDDDSFKIREKVLARSPHFPVWVEYTRDGKTYPVSEVIAVASSVDCRFCARDTP